MKTDPENNAVTQLGQKLNELNKAVELVDVKVTIFYFILAFFIAVQAMNAFQDWQRTRAELRIKLIELQHQNQNN